jgi:DNA-binding MarR family transcriptional regulator
MMTIPRSRHISQQFAVRVCDRRRSGGIIFHGKTTLQYTRKWGLPAIRVRVHDRNCSVTFLPVVWQRGLCPGIMPARPGRNPRSASIMTLQQLRMHYAAARFYRMNLTQTEALCAVAEHGSATVGIVSAQINVTTASITHISDALVLHGYVNRRAGTSDRRTIWLDITPLGRAVVTNILRRTLIPVEVIASSLEEGQMAAAS